MYVALSRVTNIEGLFLIGEFSERAIRVNTKADNEYQRLRQDCMFKPMKEIMVSPDSITICLLNVRSLPKHAQDIAADHRLCGIDLLCLTKTQLLPHQNIAQIESSLSQFNILYNNVNHHRFNNLAFGFKNTIVIEKHLKLNGILLITFKTSSFSLESISIALIYDNKAFPITSF